MQLVSFYQLFIKVIHVQIFSQVYTQGAPPVLPGGQGIL